MYHSFGLLMALVLTACSSGCGTCVSLVDREQDNKIYGGVQTDMKYISKMLQGDAGGARSASGGGQSEAIGRLALVGLPFADLILSGIADTLLLPSIFLWEHIRTPPPSKPAIP